MSLPSALNLPFVEELYTAWSRDAAAVPVDWAAWFAADAPSASAQAPADPAQLPADPAPAPTGGARAPARVQAPAPPPRPAPVLAMAAADRQERVDMLIRVYRVRGHVVAQLDPLGSSPTTRAR